MTTPRLASATPILMYHAFAGPGEPASRFIIPLRRFSLQMAWLKGRRYHVLSLNEYLDYRRQSCPPPERSVVITIDDGYREVLTRAYPVLRRHGFPATVFLPTRRMGACNDWDRDGPLAGRPLLSWSEALALLDGGLSFGAHTRTHPRLATLGVEQARCEIAGSRADLEQALSMQVRHFAYPFGEYNAALEAEAADAGFEAACSVDPGLNTAATPVFALRRMEVFGTDSLLRFAVMLWVGNLLPRRKRP